MRFFRISSANTEIEKLEAENAKLKDEIKSANENASTVATAAEQLKADNLALTASIASHASILAAKDSDITRLNAELSAAKSAVIEFDAKLEKAASAKALEICAAQGHVPIKGSKPVDTPAKAQEATQGLTGMDRIRASIQGQFERGELPRVK